MSLDYFLAIPGKVVVAGYQPDGDSIRFIADDPRLFLQLQRGNLIRPSQKDGSVQLRLEGIDAPETHYGIAAQPYGNTSRDRFLGLLGFNGLQYGQNSKTVVSSDPKAVEATIFTRGAEVHGRPISYLFVGKTDTAVSGDTGPLGLSLLKQTVNYGMVAAGHAYPLLYSSTPTLHRAEIRNVAKLARATKSGIWAFDETELFSLIDEESIGRSGSLIFPKLFRRCCDYLKIQGTSSVGGDLTDWLLRNPGEDDELFIETTSSVGGPYIHLHDLVSQRNSKIAIQSDVSELVFIEK
jgi:hypothetical protein